MSGPAAAAAVPFRGTGAAGRWWRATLGLLAAAAALLAVYAAGAAASRSGGGLESGSWVLLVLFAVAWLVGIVALATWAAAAGLAAAGRGRLARPVLALGAAVFLLGAAVCTLSLRATGSPGLVGFGLVASLAGAFASVAAWRRPPPAPGEAVPAGQA